MKLKIAPNLVRLHSGELVISRIVKYRNSIKIVREMTKEAPTPTKKKGQKVTYLSQSSLNRLAFTVHNTRYKFLSILTLTYSEQWPKTGREVKTHLNSFLVSLRYGLKSALYVWFLEFQKRGAPHLHILLTVPVDEDRRGWLAERWVAATGTTGENAEKMLRVHRHEKAWENARSHRGAKSYALKYATKTEQKEVPPEFSDVGRFWGCSRAISRDAKEVEWECDASDYEAWAAVKKFGRDDMVGWEYLPADVWLPDDDQ